MSGRITTHVLDTTSGRPAAGIRVALTRDGIPVSQAVTDTDGRVTLVEGGAMAAGVHELTFSVGAHFGGTGFLDEVPVRFRIDDPDQRFHVPLLVSPWSYATYRGS